MSVLRILRKQTAFRSPGFFKHDAPVIWALWGRSLLSSLQLASLAAESRTFQAHNTRHEATRGAE